MRARCGPVKTRAVKRARRVTAVIVAALLVSLVVSAVRVVQEQTRGCAGPTS
jgi:hypothetical protein